MRAADISGYVLVGGRSQRLGSPKPWIEVEGQPLWLSMSSLLEGALKSKPRLVGGTSPEVSYFGYELIPDASVGKGPLGGLVSALRDTTASGALILPVDLPFLTTGDLEALFAAVQPEDEVIIFRQNDSISPLPGFYHKNTLPFWERQLKQDDLALWLGIQKLRWKPVLLPPASRALFNLNTPSDLERANALGLKIQIPGG